LPAISSLSLQPVLIPRAIRNAMPSVHFACALLIWWNVARLSLRWRIAAALFLLLTVFATLGFGEHYLIDLIVAVPFSVAAQAAFLHVSFWATRERSV